MLLHICLLNGFLALLMLFFNWRVNRNVVFLASMILVISIYTLAYHVIAIEPSRFWAALFYANLAPLWYLPGPFLYWYVRGNLEDRIRFRKSDWLHLIPFVISWVGILPYLMTSFQHKLETVDAILQNPNTPKFAPPNWLLPVEWNLLLRPGLLISYAVSCIWMVVRAQGTFSQSPSVPRDQWVFLRNWMLLLSGVLIIVSVPPLLLSHFYSTDMQIDFGRINAYSMSSATAYVQTLISITLLVFPQILYGIPRTAQTGTAIPSMVHAPVLEVASIGPLDTVDSMQVGEEDTEEQAPFVELGRRVLHFMEERKPYLNPDFTLDDLARSMGVPKHHLYYCFQNILKTKFTRMRTDFRIAHAKQQLAEADLSRSTLIVLGKESGFASTSAFYTTFKAEVGCSPGEYAAKVNPSYSGG